MVSGELFQMDAEFREKLNQQLPKKRKIAEPQHRPEFGQYSVVFAVISESDEPQLSIPFFSKISLRHVINRLSGIGFKVSLTKVSVEEMKKKKKTYAPTK